MTSFLRFCQDSIVILVRLLHFKAGNGSREFADRARSAYLRAFVLHSIKPAA